MQRRDIRDQGRAGTLNVAQFGPGIFGAEAASRRFFGKPAANLDEHEAAQLAASMRRRMDKAEFLRRLI